MKELVYPRLLLPAIEQFADKVAFIDGELPEHLRRARRPGAAPGARHASPARAGAGGPVRGDGAELPPVPRALPRRLPRARASINPLNLRLAGAELQHILRDSGTKVVFVDAHVRRAPGAGHRRRCATSRPSSTSCSSATRRPTCPTTSRYEDLIAAGEPVVPPEPEEDDPVVLMYTGGTTGLPKGVLLDQRAEMLNLYHAGHRRSASRATAPTCTRRRCSTPRRCRPSSASPRSAPRSVFIPMFDPAGVLDVIERHGVSQTVMVPDDGRHAMLDHPDYRPERLESLEALTYGASPMPAVAAGPAARGAAVDRAQPGLRHDRVLGGAHAA